MRRTIKPFYAVLSILVAQTSHGHPLRPAPSSPRPLDVICNAGMATLRINRHNIDSDEQSFILQGWPASKTQTYIIDVDKWDGTLEVKAEGSLMKDGQAVAQSKKEIVLSVKQMSKGSPKIFTVFLFSDASCRFSVSLAAARSSQ